MKTFTLISGIIGFLFVSSGVIFWILNLLLPKKTKLKIDEILKVFWLSIDEKKVSQTISAYSKNVKRLYSDPISTKKRKYKHGRKINKNSRRKTILVLVAFILPFLILAGIHLYVTDESIFLFFPNGFDQYYTVSGTLSIILASGVINLWIYKVLSNVFDKLSSVQSFGSTWGIIVLVFLLLLFSYPVVGIVWGFFFHILFPLEIFLFPNHPAFYIWSPSIMPMRNPLSNYQWDFQIFIAHANLFFQESLHHIKNFGFYLSPTFFAMLTSPELITSSAFIINLALQIISYIPLYPVLLYLFLFTILLIIKFLMRLAIKPFTYLAQRIIDNEIAEEERKNRFPPRKLNEEEPSLLFIAYRLFSLGGYMLGLFSALAILYPITTP